MGGVEDAVLPAAARKARLARTRPARRDFAGIDGGRAGKPGDRAEASAANWLAVAALSPPAPIQCRRDHFLCKRSATSTDVDQLEVAFAPTQPARQPAVTLIFQHRERRVFLCRVAQYEFSPSRAFGVSRSLHTTFRQE